MKTKLLTLAAITVGILAINSAHAESCEGGTLRTGDNGHVFCQSNNDMNWWSAYAWCEAQGRHLTTMYEISPTWDGSTGINKCDLSSFPSGAWNWTATAAGTQYAFLCGRTDIPNIGTTDTNRNLSRCRALCY